jgi:hypothetical protein
MMYKPLTEDLGESVLTWCLEGSLVQTYPVKAPSLETTKGLTGTDRDCGWKWHGLLAKYDPDTHSLKTAQISLFEDSMPFSAILPKWGWMRDGVLSEQTPPEWITNANESGLLPTVMASDWKGGTTAIRKDRGDYRMDQWRDYVKIKYGLTYPHPTHSELRMGWPQRWTDLRPLEMDKYLEWQLLHGEHLHRDFERES